MNALSPCTRVEVTGNIIVHHPISDDVASPGVWVGDVYFCACNGCGCCKGREANCTCDVDWEKVYGH